MKNREKEKGNKLKNNKKSTVEKDRVFTDELNDNINSDTPSNNQIMDLDEYFSNSNIAKRKINFFQDDIEIFISVVESKFEGIRLRIDSLIHILKHKLSNIQDKKAKREFDKKYKVPTAKHKKKSLTNDRKIAKKVLFNIGEAKEELVYKLDDSKKKLTIENKRNIEKASSSIKTTTENLSNKMKNASKESELKINEFKVNLLSSIKLFAKKILANVNDRKEKLLISYNDFIEKHKAKNKRFKEKTLSDITCFKQKLAYRFKDFDRVVPISETDELPKDNTNQNTVIGFVKKVLIIILLCLIIFFIISFISAII